MNSIVPVAITMPDWNAYSSIFEENSVPSPTRALDLARIPKTDVTSYLRVLAMSGSVELNDARSLRHVSVSFLGVFENRSIFADLAAAGYLSFLRKDMEGHDWVLMTGSLADWAAVVPIWAKASIPMATRRIVTTVYEKLAPFRMWDHCRTSFNNNMVIFN